MNFCKLPEVFLFGSQSSKSKNRHKKVKKLTTKTGNVKIAFKFLFFDFNAKKRTEAKMARKETKSQYQANAILDKMEVTKRVRKVRVRFLSGVLKSRSKE